ncbi:MAG: hypothetical protein LQ352_002745 [Teloschistes flavicans]|nr:MAG: hypothetical protein LQ352_002745 [Teloschistes flavicans]
MNERPFSLVYTEEEAEDPSIKEIILIKTAATKYAYSDALSTSLDLPQGGKDVAEDTDSDDKNPTTDMTDTQHLQYAAEQTALSYLKITNVAERLDALTLMQNDALNLAMSTIKLLMRLAAAIVRNNKEEYKEAKACLNIDATNIAVKSIYDRISNAKKFKKAERSRLASKPNKDVTVWLFNEPEY